MLHYTKFNDPGHGWLEVPIADLMFVDLAPSDFTPYSYRRGQYLYLEEDCDASKFIKALRETSLDFHITDLHTNDESPIRNYRSIYW
jgi:hypothetical protein